jgi:hypothetical protein
MSSATIVQKLCNYYNVPRDAGMRYGDYVSSLANPIFLKCWQALQVKDTPSTAWNLRSVFLLRPDSGFFNCRLLN